MAATTKNSPKSPTSPTPSVASQVEASTEQEDKDSHLFKTNLQVLLKRQDTELVKNLEYKKKLEEGEEIDSRKDGMENEGERTKEERKKKGHKESNNREKTSLVRKTTDVSDVAERENAEGDDEVFEEMTEGKSKKNENKGKKNGKSKEKAKGSKSPEMAKCKKGKEKPQEVKKENETEKKRKKSEQKLPNPEKEPIKEPSSPKCPRVEEVEDKTPLTPKETKSEKVILEKTLDNAGLENKKSEPNEKSGGTSGEEYQTGKPEDKNKEGKDNKLAVSRGSTPEAQRTGTPSSGSPEVEPESKRNQNAAEVPKTPTNVAEEDSNKCSNAKPVKKQKHQGTLMKKGSSPFSLWKKYYFVLDGKLLMYYRSESDYKGLAGAKGSLDLTLLEDVKIKKPGRLKTNFPFGLYRRNLRTINLATDTNEERERWMAILLGTKRHETRLSGSDNALSTADSPVEDAKRKKYATMPAGSVAPDADVSSSDSEPEEKKEEDSLIQPKKIGRVGLGVQVDLNAIRLKRVDQDSMKVGKPTDSEKEVTDGTTFGVKLKKPTVKGASVSESVTDEKEIDIDKTALSKRPNKQPNIPLRKSPLLSHADIESDTRSLNSTSSNKTDRKRSPSPCIPLSKGVHAVLAKSNEEVEGEGEDSNELNVCTAQSREIRYSEAALSMEDDISVEYLQVEEEVNQISEDLKGMEEERENLPENGGVNEFPGMPQVSVTVRENNEEIEYEEFDEEFLRKMKENKTAELSQRESGKFSDGNNPETPESDFEAKRSEKGRENTGKIPKCDERQGTSELDIPKISLNLGDSDTESVKGVELRVRHHSARDEKRSSTYSRSSVTSNDVNPPPLVPEKKVPRSRSPAHDVPQNNRPVTAHACEEKSVEAEKDDEKVDGVISLDQIDAILSAKDNKEKKRRSGCRDSGLAEYSQNSSGKPEGTSYSRMSSVVSITSTESDEPLPKFNFLSCPSNSSSSRSSSDAQSDTCKAFLKSLDQETPVTLRHSSRLTEPMYSGPRVSLTFPEYTVIEEDGPGTPDSIKSPAGIKSENAFDKEEDEKKDYFPVIGGDVTLRNPSQSRSQQFSDAGLRTSGINSLKAYLEENQEDLSSSRSGISRLGHSAAVEKLKRESSEES